MSLDGLKGEEGWDTRRWYLVALDLSDLLVDFAVDDAIWLVNRLSALYIAGSANGKGKARGHGRPAACLHLGDMWSAWRWMGSWMLGPWCGARVVAGAGLKRKLWQVQVCCKYWCTVRMYPSFLTSGHLYLCKAQLLTSICCRVLLYCISYCHFFIFQ